MKKSSAGLDADDARVRREKVGGRLLKLDRTKDTLPPVRMWGGSKAEIL